MKQSNNEANLREEVLKNLATAYDNFVELVANLKEGTKVCVHTRETRAAKYRWERTVRMLVVFPVGSSTVHLMCWCYCLFFCQACRGRMLSRGSTILVEL